MKNFLVLCSELFVQMDFSTLLDSNSLDGGPTILVDRPWHLPSKTKTNTSLFVVVNLDKLNKLIIIKFQVNFLKGRGLLSVNPLPLSLGLGPSPSMINKVMKLP